MKHTYPGPCDDFDMATDYAKKGAKCHGSRACSWYERNLMQDEADNDPQGPCKRRNMVTDSRTVDMFGDHTRMGEGA